MIRRSVISTLFLFGAAGIASAQGVTVQSGDHAGFTRLVARIGEDREWQITRDGREIHIAFPPDSPAFDLSRVYDLISHDRLRDVRDLDGLALSLACDCTISITRYRNRYAVIDIADPEDEPPAPEPAVDLPLFTGRATLPQRPGPALPTPPVTPVLDTPQPAGFAMEDAGNLLAEQLARAAAAGLLDPAPGQPLSLGDPLPRQDPPTESSPPTEAPARPAAAPPPINAANAYDLNLGTTTDRLTISAASSCIPAPARAVSEWSGNIGFFNGVGRLRADAYDDRGRLDEARALELAELYLVHGFGAEAAFWLGEMQTPPAFQTAMADFVDYRTDGVFGTFADHELCPDDLLLWLFLSDSTAEPLVETTATILAQYYALPTILRDMLGPDLARAFVRAGQGGAALEVRAALIRGGRLSPQQMAFLDLDLPGTPTPPENRLTPANAGTARADAALSHRLMTQIHTLGAATPADLTASDALVLETDPGLIQGGLRHAAALGHALSGNIEGTLAHLSLRGPHDSEALGPVFADILSSLMALDRPAPLLLLLSSDEFGQFGQFPNAAFRRQVAEFLLDRGLPAIARDLILAGGSDHDRDRVLLSRAFDRLAEDQISPLSQTTPESTSGSAAAPVETPAEMAALLSESRELRAELEQLLSRTPPADPGS